MPIFKPSAVLLSLVCAASSILGVGSANPIVGRPGTEPASYTLETVHQFPNFTWLENLAIRSTGEIVATDISNGVIYLVDPGEDPAPVSVIAQFPPGTCLTGIAELRPDVFYVQSVDGFVYNFTFTPGSATLWEVDLRDQARGAVVTKVLDMPENKVPNGLGVLPTGRKGRGESTLLLSADSGGGVVHLIDVVNKSYSVVFDHPLLKPNATARPPFGVNGVHVVPGDADADTSTLYFTNTNFGYLGAVTIGKNDGTPRGEPWLITDEVPAADDFAIDSDGSFWVTQNVRQTLSHVLADGTVEFVAGGVDSADLLGPVAAAFGRTSEDRANGVLYISTDGVHVDPATGSVTRTAGKIARLATKRGSGQEWGNW
ncbi:hypothetical protein AYO20_10318 [Fonsecaea nubica]|uniref:SMP-30/Gluconolactonase/LRE-like region domain-containing protein n=1 Tax=Fonsecaea nubica TaxID=856822 RepID=A0A178C9D2_9EURO|nr:hypothetical protein AYO20_10318 [Fonsecaea nubica]OAL25856.1 hypothetical protein AYO20_10318 [Fonsecaea nubica]